MKTSKKLRQESRRLFRNCIVNGDLDENRVRQTVRLVISEKPRGYVPILSHFTRLLKLEEDSRAARIESAAPLSPETQMQVRQQLTRRYGNRLNFIFTQNPALLGGMRVQVGGDVYDGSVESRLRALQESF